MKLNLNNIIEINSRLTNMSYYDIISLREKTRANPKWLHFGAGNIFRGYIARINQDLIQKGWWDSGIIVAESFDDEIIEKIYRPYDSLALVVTLHREGNFSVQCISNLAEAILIKDKKRLYEILNFPELQIISFTITEKGYSLRNPSGELFPEVQRDIAGMPKDSNHLMGIITELLYERYKNIQNPVALLSLDNCSENGKKLKESIIFYAKSWIENGKMEREFLDYLESEEKVAFPWSMIDKITPRPAQEVKEYLEKLGFEKMDSVITSRYTYIAPYVNLEELEYLVIEDHFPNGRPPLEKAGVFMTSRTQVSSAEKMKVTACLNPLHTALAVFGCLLGYHRISEEMEDRELVNLLKKIGYDEALPVLEDPKILSPQKFIDEVIEIRLPNPYIPDTPQRIVTDTSQKIPIRFGETIKSYAFHQKVTQLEYIPLVLAGWLRYLLAVDDEGNELILSPDPLLEELTKNLEGISYDYYCETKGLNGLLENTSIFGIDLKNVGLSGKVKAYLEEMCQGKYAVRKTLKKYLG